MVGERTVSRSTFTAGGSAFPVMGEHEVSRAALEAGGSGFPAREGALGAAGWQQRLSCEGGRLGAALSLRSAAAPAWPLRLAAASFSGRGDKAWVMRMTRAVSLGLHGWRQCLSQERTEHRGVSLLVAAQSTDDRTPLGESPSRGKLCKNGVECPARHLQDSQGQRARLSGLVSARGEPPCCHGGR